MKAKKVLLLVLCAVLLVVGSVMGTLAYLQDTTDAVENTFTVGKVDIELTETWNTDSDDEDTENDSWSAKLIPGKEYAKDPKVTVVGGSEPCYLFVKVTETNNPTTYLDYTYIMTGESSGWTSLDKVEGVYWIEVANSDSDQTWNLLVGDKVTVKNSIVNSTTEDVADDKVAMPETNGDAPSITFTAYAIQKEGFVNAEAAWSGGNFQ